MKLYNCETKKELELKGTKLALLTEVELAVLADETKKMFEDAELKDENIAMDALHQISQELFLRLRIANRINEKAKNN